jgi:hypothetical protein
MKYIRIELSLLEVTCGALQSRPSLLSLPIARPVTERNPAVWRRIFNTIRK